MEQVLDECLCVFSTDTFNQAIVIFHFLSGEKQGYGARFLSGNVFVRFRVCPEAFQQNALSFAFQLSQCSQAQDFARFAEGLSSMKQSTSVVFASPLIS